ncbi:DUF6597 domain-containing transcriptional factor [Chitinophagaceae bacterium MMS25-I14]
MSNDLEYRSVQPDTALSDYVESFWMLRNESGNDKEVVILPDGRIDLFFSASAGEPFHTILLGIGTRPEQTTIAPHTLMFAVSFKLPAAEYILHEPVAELLDNGKSLPADFWGFSVADLDDFDRFCEKAAQKIMELLPGETDSRKQQLFELIYASKGSFTVKELSEKVFWSSRQINRYFDRQYGLSLKAYGNILRFRASFPHIREGKLFPQEDFADQSHFIREVKKLAGVSPKELFKNQNDRFIQFSTLGRR